jgi:uncharacterized membrane protein HdeD (DUF308 family)
MTMRSLVRNWWMMAIRGALAIAFGIAVHAWPDVTLSTIVVIFGGYALADGAWAIAAGVHASARVLDAWPVVLEGVVSIALGLVALFQPFLPREVIWELAAWGIITGSLEVIIAADVPHSRPGYWLLITGAAASVFLAVLIVLLPHAAVELVARIITAYAQVFGIVLVFAAMDFARQRGAHAAPSPSR